VIYGRDVSLSWRLSSLMAPQPKKLDALAIAMMLGLCASWGLNQVAAKVALADIPPITQSAFRSLGGTVLLGAYALWREPAVWRRDGSFGPGLVLGFLFAVEFIALYLGVQWTSASRAILFLYTAPFFFALGATVFLPQERLSAMQWAGFALAFCGVAAALLGHDGQGVGIGDVFAVAAAAFWGATTLQVKTTVLRGAPATKILLYQLAVSVPITALAALLWGETFPAHISALSALSLAYQIAWVASVTYLGWFWLVARYRAGELSAFTFLTPVIGVAAGHLLLGDELSQSFLGALALVAAGIVLVNWPRGRSDAPAFPPDPE
jgi:drug/metabolite transporter (DMT)-like permease